MEPAHARSPWGMHNTEESWRKGGDGSSTPDLLVRPGKRCRAALGSWASHVLLVVSRAAKASVADGKHSEGCRKAESEGGQNANRHGRR